MSPRISAFFSADVDDGGSANEPLDVALFCEAACVEAPVDEPAGDPVDESVDEPAAGGALPLCAQNAGIAKNKLEEIAKRAKRRMALLLLPHRNGSCCG